MSFRMQLTIWVATMLVSLSVSLEAQEVKLGNPGKSLNFFVFDLAKEKGFFREEGLDLKVISMKCDIAITALLTGDLDATGCVGTASRVIASQNVPVRTVVWLFKKPTFYVFARPEIKSGADFKGKIVGISSFGSDTDLSLKAFVQRHGLDPEKDIKRIVSGATSTRLAALKAGSIDATTLAPPYDVYAEQMGLRNLGYVGDFLEFPQSGFTVSDTVLQSKRDLVKRLIRGTLRGLRFVFDHRAETARFIAKDYNLSEAVADKVYGSLLPALSEDGTATDQGLKVMLDTIGIALKKEVSVPASRLIDYGPLRQVQREMGLAK